MIIPRIIGLLERCSRTLRSYQDSVSKKSPPMYSGDYATWQEASALCAGYDTDIIFEKTKTAALAVRDGKAAFERDSVLFARPEYRWGVLAALLWQASRDRGTLRVLDFGGSLGSVYFQSLNFLKGLPEVKWGIVEQKHYVKFGQAELSNDSLAFFETIEQCAAALTPNVFFFGGVLQYLDDPYAFLDTVLAHRPPTLVFDKNAFINRDSDRIVIQQVPPEIYAASYPAWFFSEPKFNQTLEAAGYSLHSDWINFDKYPLEDAKIVFKGALFVRND